jgi:hypothetical protein
MFVKDWLLPILIGIVAAIALISILYNNPKVKQAFADIGAMMQLNASKPQVMTVMPVILENFENSNYNSNSQLELLTDNGQLTELQSKKLELSNAKLWNPLPSQYSCTSENINESNALNILNSPNIYNYYPQITNKL